jgi:hypothetical protein
MNHFVDNRRGTKRTIQRATVLLMNSRPCSLVVHSAEDHMLRMVKDSERDELRLQHTGQRKGNHGYSVSILTASFRGTTFRIEMGGGPCSDEEPYRVLYQLRPDGFHVEACATCKHFRFSGLTRDWSAGSRGYCTHPLGKPRPSGHSPTTFRFGCQFASVEDYCPKYSFSHVPTCAIRGPSHARVD